MLLLRSNCFGTGGIIKGLPSGAALATWNGVDEVFGLTVVWNWSRRSRAGALNDSIKVR